MTNNTIGAIAAASMDIIGTAFKLGSGEITLGKAIKDIGKSVGAAYGAIVASGWGYAGGMALAGMIGLGTIGAVGIVKAGKEVVKSVASGVWNGVKAAGGAIVGGATAIVKGVGSAIGSIASGIGSAVSSFCSGVASFFGW